MGCLTRRHLLRGAGGDHIATFIPSFRPEVDYVIGALDHVHIVFDDHQGVPLRHQPVEGSQELADICEVQARGGFVEDKEGVPLAAAYMASEL